MCNEMVVARVLIDNGSAINVCPLVTIMKLGIDESTIRPSDITIRAFDGSKRQILGDIDLPVEIGPYTFEVEFQVLDIPETYNFLLGRPWVHSAGAVPSSLHQKKKYIVRDHLVTVHAEEDLTVLRSPAIPYIDVENDIVPNARNAFELVQANYVAEGSVPARPKISANSMMVAKVMLNSGYKLDSGLGQNWQGRLEPIQVNDKKVPYGLGFKPTKKDKQQVAAQKSEISKEAVRRHGV